MQASITPPTLGARRSARSSPSSGTCYCVRTSLSPSGRRALLSTELAHQERRGARQIAVRSGDQHRTRGSRNRPGLLALERPRRTGDDAVVHDWKESRSPRQEHGHRLPVSDTMGSAESGRRNQRRRRRSTATHPRLERSPRRGYRSALRAAVSHISAACPGNPGASRAALSSTTVSRCCRPGGSFGLGFGVCWRERACGRGAAAAGAD